MKKMISVAIDGPAGVGKSTASKLVAEKLGWNCLNTGALYRAFTVKCLEMNVDLFNEDEIEKAVDKVEISVKFINGVQRVYANGEDLTNKIRSEIVDKNVPYISKARKLREKIKKLQRIIATKNNVVVEGRDIGSVILPETVNKFFLTASAEIRAQRRYEERVAKNEKVDFDEILADIKLRDKLDTEREVSPLKIMPDAKVIDTSHKTIEEVVDEIFAKIKTNICEKVK